VGCLRIQYRNVYKIKVLPAAVVEMVGAVLGNLIHNTALICIIKHDNSIQLAGLSRNLTPAETNIHKAYQSLLIFSKTLTFKISENPMHNLIIFCTIVH
jgi:hypothetical protein